ncbi:MAG: helix-turn-helix transcriptional regulator [Liquorilactobacillus hordei]|uniref:helix-turn-helix domain-containing protein n=1 Tax=Liquorilactobacillus hordei TaxID=468911 RepID=UPI0039E77AA7
MNLYDAIKEVSKEKGVSIYKMEKDLDLTNGTICKWNKSMPAANKLQNVANYLDVTISFLFNKADTEKQSV